MKLSRNDVSQVLDRTLFATFSWALILTALDLELVLSVAHGNLEMSRLLGFSGLCLGAVVLVVGPLFAVRALCLRWSDKLLARAGIGALIGGFFAYFACYLQDYETLGMAVRYGGAIALIAAFALLEVLAPRFRKATRVLGLLVACGALLVDRALPLRELSYTHLALMLIACDGWLIAWPPARETSRASVWHLTAVLLLNAASIGAIFGVRHDPVVRAMLHHQSHYAQTHAQVLPNLYRVHRAKPMPRCPTNADECKPPMRIEDPVARLHASASGADVMMLSIDALRWDHVSAIEPLLREIGPHVQFDNAFSPAPRTVHSFAAMLRGRPLRQVSHGFREKNRMGPEAEPTLARVLKQAGMRVLNVPGHAFLLESEGIAAEFEVPLSEAEKQTLERRRFLPSEVASERILEAARNTAEPLFVWSHAMEAHAPYRWNGGTGPETPEGQKHALSDLARTLSERIRAFRSARKGRKLAVVIFADHGEEFGEHGGQYHGSTLHTEHTHVAFMLAAEGLAPRTIHAPVSTTAIAATIFDLLGLARPCSFTVPSLLACAEGNLAACPAMAVSEIGFLISASVYEVAYTSGTHRLHYNYREDLTSLFSLRDDPYEQEDLVGRDSARADVVQLFQLGAAFDQQFCCPGK